MGTLRHLQTGKEVELSGETLIGRSPRCRLVLEHPLVSSLHARVRWLGAQWAIADLSRNGTWVNGRTHRRDESIPLVAGDCLCFGRNDDAWVLSDASAPRALLIPLGGTAAPILLSHGPVALPSDERAQASVFLDPDGLAVLETAEKRMLLTDGAECEIAGTRYLLQLACPHPPTAAAGASLQDALLTLTPALHEEHVGVTLTLGGQVCAMRPRVHFAILLELARERLADRARGLTSQAEGWLGLEVLCDRLQLDRPTFNTHAHRLRKQFSTTNLVDAVNIVERRVDSDEVRIGCGNLAIEPG